MQCTWRPQPRMCTWQPGYLSWLNATCLDWLGGWVGRAIVIPRDISIANFHIIQNITCLYIWVEGIEEYWLATFSVLCVTMRFFSRLEHDWSTSKSSETLLAWDPKDEELEGKTKPGKVGLVPKAVERGRAPFKQSVSHFNRTHATDSNRNSC